MRNNSSQAEKISLRLLPYVITGGFLNSSPNHAIDLHIHSSFSDGLLTPSHIVQLAKDVGLRAISVTDHDDVRSVPHVMHAAADSGLEVIPGIELSCMQGTYETHLLGYFIDPQNEQLSSFTRQFRLHREDRAQKILYRLSHLGINIPFEVLKLKAGESSLGRPHIADLLVEEGAVFSYQEAFYKYLGDGRPAFVPKMKVPAEQGIKLIHDAGGLAFIAHPGNGIDTDTLDQLIDLGLDGIESIHPKHSPMMIEMYREYAYKNGLLETGGSDCHGGRRGEIMLGTLAIPYDLLDHIKTRHAQLRMTRSA